MSTPVQVPTEEITRLHFQVEEARLYGPAFLWQSWLFIPVDVVTKMLGMKDWEVQELIDANGMFYEIRGQICVSQEDLWKLITGAYDGKLRFPGWLSRNLYVHSFPGAIKLFTSKM